MILYLQYGSGASQVHLDLVGTEITTEEINAGAFATPSQEMTQTTIRVSIEGRPNIYVTTTTIGDIINQVQVSNGRSIGARVYLFYQPANQSIVYRAKVRALAFAPDPAGGQYWKIQRHVKGEFSVVHEIWEGELVEVPLTNAYGTEYGTSEPSGIRIDNTQDTTHTNEVLIHDVDVIGDAPAPAKIVLRNTYNDANIVDRVFIGHNVYSAPNTFQQVWEVEDANGVGAPTANANFSDGNYVRVSPPGGAVSSTFFWNLTANDIAYMAGNQFHCLLRMGGTFGEDAFDCYYYIYLANNGSSLPIWLSEPLYLPANQSGIEDLGVIRLPPWRVDEANLTQAMRLYMLVYSEDATAKDADLDALHLFPVDGYRDIRLFAGLYAGYTERIIDDEIEDELYLDTGAGTGRSNTIVAFGNKIMLQPGKDQKLYFIASDDSVTIPCDIARTWEVTVYYRPRRLAL